MKHKIIILLVREVQIRLRQWDERFVSARDRVRALGFDETFVRMWNFYLAYSEAGFAADYLDDLQIGLSRG